MSGSNPLFRIVVAYLFCICWTLKDHILKREREREDTQNFRIYFIVFKVCINRNSVPNWNDKCSCKSKQNSPVHIGVFLTHKNTDTRLHIGGKTREYSGQNVIARELNLKDCEALKVQCLRQSATVKFLLNWRCLSKNVFWAHIRCW